MFNDNVELDVQTVRCSDYIEAFTNPLSKICSIADIDLGGGKRTTTMVKVAVDNVNVRLSHDVARSHHYYSALINLSV